MFTVPLIATALVLLVLGVALAIPCFARTCGDPVLRFGESAANLKLYWAGLAAGLLLVASGLVVSVAAANEMGTYKARPAPTASPVTSKSASYSGG